MELVQCSRTNPEYKKIRDGHYVANHGCIGRQLHYLIYDETEIIGIISGASAVWAVQPRDTFFGIDKVNRVEKIGAIIDNVVFRLIKNEHNLATKILKLWRNKVVKDWEAKYSTPVVGFETFVFGDNRTGACYKADNWTFVGTTKGSTKLHEHGCYNPQTRVKTVPKLIFCRFIQTGKSK